MAANKQPDWRDAGNESAPRSTGASAGNRPWQPSDGPAGDSLAPSKRGIKRTIALFALIGIAISFGAVIVWLRPIPPACLVLIGSGYETNLLLPANVHGWNGLVHTEKVVAEESGLGKYWRWDQPTKLRKVGEPIELKDTSWSAMWEKINVQSYEEPTVVVFLSMHGMADDQEAYLLPNLPSELARKSFDSNRIPFREVLDTLIAVKKKNVVLLLDVSHVQSYWPIGMMHDDFIKRLQDKYDHEINETKHLTVICSAGPNQHSWASDELQKTVFSHYVALGLQGGGHNAKDNVNALSLYEYVAAKVETWAKTNRARNQTPILLGGKDRARSIALVHVAKPPEETPPEIAPFPSAKMLSEWNQWKELKTDHVPQVHSPHYWRLYQDTLVRYEQLMRAGNPTGKAADLKKSLSALYSEIAVSRSLDRAYKCLGNSFPMPQVLGFPVSEPISDAELQAFLLELRNVHNIKGENEKEKNKVYERFSNRSVLEKQYIQTRVSQLVLQQLDRLATPDRLRDTVLLTEIEDRLRGAHRAAVVHLLRMFKDADGKADEKTLQLALRVRALAEEAALSARREGSTGELYSEVIFRWSRPNVESADQLRRDGEDHLFGDPKTHGERARKKLDDAESAYREVLKQAKNLQNALALRDEVSADLPYLATWLAQPHLHQNKEMIQTQRMAAELLGNRLAVLNRDLDDPTRKAPPNSETIAQMGDDLRTMRAKYREVGEKLKLGGLQQDWHGIDTALLIPPMDVSDVGLRIALLTKQRDISGQLIKNPAPQGQSEDEDAPAVRVERERKLFQASIKSLHEMRVAGKENVDDQVRNFFFKLPGEILAKADQAVERKDLVAAATMCRGIPGAFVDFVKDDTKKRVNPVDRLRRINMGRLLQWQAKRGLEDHWFDPAKETPYYQTAAEAYLTSTTNLFDEGQVPDTLRNEGAALNKKLTTVGLKVTRPEKLFWMNDPELTFPFKVDATAALPTGTPMVFLEVMRGKAVQKIWPRKAIDPWKSPNDKYLLDNDSFSGAGEMTILLHAYYRGEHLKTTTVTVRATPDVIVKHTPADKDNTSLAVRMDSTFDYGAISIVLDTSGSMEFQHPKAGGMDQPGDAKKKNRRFDFALDALEYALRRVPDKTELGIFTFGDNSPISTFRASSPWLREDLGTLRKRLDALPLGGGSPIADAIIRTMDDGFPIAGFKGPKLILVLTDGADTTSNVRGGPGRDDRIAKLLKAANDDPKNKDIAVVVVCFIDKETEKAEYDSAEAQFSVVRDFSLKGKFLDVSQGPKLGQSIDGMIRPRVELVKLNGQKAHGFEKGAPVNFRLDQSLVWNKVKPGDYKAHVEQTSYNPPIDLEMPIGQKMFAVLQRFNNKLSLKRGILAYQREARERQTLQKETPEWVASLFENENRGFKSEQLAVFEKRNHDPNRIRQPLPGFVWLELDAVKGAKPAKTLRWWRDWNVPAAGYRVEMEGWAPNRFPKMSTWFAPQEKEEFVRNRTLIRTKNYPVPLLAPPDAELDNHALVEAINWREAEVEDAKGGKVKKDCLIVRVRHAPGRPVWVDLATRGPNVGSEHQYFTQASSCTVFFYGLSRRDLVDLTLMDIVDFKAGAQTAEFAPDIRIVLPGLFVPG